MCSKKPRWCFGLFKTNCPEVRGEVCDMKERHPKLPAPSPPPPKRIISEDVKVRPLTEGKVRGGMSNAMKKTRSRPMFPPHGPKKAKILKKVEQKEFVARCIAVDICPTCGCRLRPWGKGKICAECDIAFNQK
jgi:hypothetical protein